jgi:dedicator of cytokinesis protein 3
MGDPPVDVRFGNDQYIQCTTVTTEPNQSLPVFANPDVPVSIRNYYEHRYVSARLSSVHNIDMNDHPATSTFSALLDL